MRAHWKRIAGVLCGALMLATASAAAAQTPGNGQIVGPGGLATGARSFSTKLTDPMSATVTAVTPTRLDRQRNRNGVYNRNPSVNEVVSAAQSEINTANVDCRVVEASLMGYNFEQQAVYEVSCGTGMGYVVGASSPPTVTDCITIAGRADMALRADPAATPVVCTLSANRNISGMVANYAREAGVGCNIDEAAMAGTSVAGNAVYEVGCTGADGYWIEKASAGWMLTPCVKVAAQSNACRFTTRDEQAATVRTWLAGTSAAACDVTDVRYMGANAQGAFYETKCGAGDGYVARLDNAMAVQQVLPCAQAAGIGGGCTLAANRN